MVAAFVEDVGWIKKVKNLFPGWARNCPSLFFGFLLLLAAASKVLWHENIPLPPTHHEISYKISH